MYLPLGVNYLVQSWLPYPVVYIHYGFDQLLLYQCLQYNNNYKADIKVTGNMLKDNFTS